MITSFITLYGELLTDHAFFTRHTKCWNAHIQYHGDFEDLMYKWELDQFAEQAAGAIHVRLRQVFRYLKDNPEVRHQGEFLIDLFVGEALQRAVNAQRDALLRCLERDGFIIDDGTPPSYASGRDRLAGCRRRGSFAVE